MKIVRLLLWAFIAYINRSLKNQFHAVRLLKGCGPPEVSLDRPLIVYLNHASWWDPLVMMWLGKLCYRGRPQYGPIEAAQLERYSFFKYLGVFGVEKGSISGARNFLRTAKAILAQRGAMIWMTPQGRFADVRERPVTFASGIAHLACIHRDAVFVPLAIEYGFGQERSPEVFLSYGAPLEGLSSGKDAQIIQDRLERALQGTLDALSQAVVQRNGTMFDTLLEGKGGASVPYDTWRRFRSALRREAPSLNHAQMP